MKRILIIHTDMEIGGAETSLIGLLDTIDYTDCRVDLLLYQRRGDMLSLVPEQVNVLDSDYGYSALTLPVRDVLVRQHRPLTAAARVLARVLTRSSRWSDTTYIIKQRAARYSLPLMRRIPGHYDIAISFIDPHYVLSRVDAAVKLAWMHTDFARIDIDKATDLAMWRCADYVVTVSEGCRQSFVAKHPELADRTLVIENIISEPLLRRNSQACDVDAEMDPKTFRLLSVGRFCTAKNFDNVPYICRRLIESGLDVKWYLIGYGGDEQLIKNNIADAGMQDRVIILGKKDNPYPYIRSCDLYVQPSRYEGKSVTVREAQMLGRPVVLTAYNTASSQVDDGIDGVIVPTDNDGCAAGIAAVVRDAALRQRLSDNTQRQDYSNRGELDKIFSLADF